MEPGNPYTEQASYLPTPVNFINWKGPIQRKEVLFLINGEIGTMKVKDLIIRRIIIYQIIGLESIN